RSTMSLPSINRELKTICDQLQALDEQIKKGVQIFDDSDFKQLLDSLHKQSNSSSRTLHQAMKKKEKRTSIDQQIKSRLLALIHSIQHSPDFVQALGHFQGEFAV